MTDMAKVGSGKPSAFWFSYVPSKQDRKFLFRVGLSSETFSCRLHNRPLSVKAGVRLQCMLGKKPRTIHIDTSAENCSGLHSASFSKQSSSDIVYRSPVIVRDFGAAIKAPPHAAAIQNNGGANGHNGYH